MGEALNKRMVLTLSLWDIHTAYMLWLDSNFPSYECPSTLGVVRICPTFSGRPEDVENRYSNSYVFFSSIKVGEINSTY